ncbi:MAG: DUF1439 domain-containing protein [Deltaproteobacteria bacterium]|nr:DUF1439 domain-containing protein [Deltaproteobacteria bacterium]
MPRIIQCIANLLWRDPVFKVFVPSILLLCIWIGACGAPEVDVTISQKSLQEKVVKKFPKEKKILIAKVMLHSPEVYLVDDKIGIRLKMKATFLKYPLEGEVDLQSGIRYDSDKGQFFATDVEIVDLQVSNKSFGDTDRLKAIITPILSEALQEKPVHTLPNETMRQKLVGKFLKKIRVQGGEMIVTFAK